MNVIKYVTACTLLSTINELKPYHVFYTDRTRNARKEHLPRAYKEADRGSRSTVVGFWMPLSSRMSDRVSRLRPTGTLETATRTNYYAEQTVTWESTNLCMVSDT